MALSADEIRRLARLGAVARLQQMREEEAAIRAEFPELFGSARRAAADRRTQGAERKNVEADLQVRLTSANSARGGARTRRRVSAAARKAASERMRRYWAARRKAKASR